MVSPRSESIDEAVAFRQTMGRVQREFQKKGEWFFNTWNADHVTEGKNGKRVAFADASPEFLAHEPDAWVLHPGETWHGFGDLEDDYCMLDPIKVSILTPGVTEKGGSTSGDPRHATAYLHRRGVEVESTDFTITRPVLDRHHEGSGDLAQRAARLQARLRYQL
jgi:arginine/lysine/ornithine decarboxylase